MRIVAALLSSAIVCGLLAIRVATAEHGPPVWAYPLNNPDYKPPVDDGRPVRVPDSVAGYTWSQLRDRFIAPVWHPSDHAALPDIVAQGRKPGVFACGFCHRAAGPGGPENADLAGLPKNYIIQQMADYKSGARGTTVPGRTPPSLMIGLSKLITDAEVEAGGRLLLGPAAAQAHQGGGERYRAQDLCGGSALGRDGSRRARAGRSAGGGSPRRSAPLRKPRLWRLTFTAYVPVGSLAKGEALVMNGGPGKTTQCALCHGADLKGLGPLPSIAGRSPSYMFRQLYDFQHGARTGEWEPADGPSRLQSRRTGPPCDCSVPRISRSVSGHERA